MRGQAEWRLGGEGKSPGIGKRGNGHDAESRTRLMSERQPGETTAGHTRDCRTVARSIRESAAVCPSCGHYLRYGGPKPRWRRKPAVTSRCAIEGCIRHPAGGGAGEYTVVVSIWNDRGEEIARKLIGVGAMNPTSSARSRLSVEAVSAKGKVPGKPERDTDAASATYAAPSPRERARIFDRDTGV
jgi:hypothetical protein